MHERISNDPAFRYRRLNVTEHARACFLSARDDGSRLFFPFRGKKTSLPIISH